MKALQHSLACLVALLLLGCPPQDSAKPPPKTPPPSKTSELPVPSGSVAELWQQECTKCHGALGDGNGDIVKSLREWPRDFTDPKWQASLDDGKLKAVILGGGPAIGRSDEMPAFAQLSDKPEQLEALIKHIRGFGKTDAPKTPKGE